MGQGPVLVDSSQRIAHEHSVLLSNRNRYLNIIIKCKKTLTNPHCITVTEIKMVVAEMGLTRKGHDASALFSLKWLLRGVARTSNCQNHLVEYFISIHHYM